MNGEINDIATGKMTNGAHYQFVKKILDEAMANAVMAEKLASNLKVLSNKVAAEDDALKLSRKSQYTDEIEAADKERDSLYSAYCTMVKAFLKNSDAEKAAAAKTLNQHIIDYAISPRMQLDRQTGMLVNFNADLAVKYADEVAKLGLTPVVTSLTAANDKLNELTTKRTEEGTAVVAGALKSARIASDEAYRNLVRRVEALWVVEYDEAYDEFINFTNELIKHYKQQVLTKRKTKKQTDETSDTTTEE